MTGDTMRAIHDLRRSLTAVATTCDAILYAPQAQAGNATQALRRLPGLLDRLAVRLDRVRLALQEEGRR
jgi:hypothetical protein